MAVDVKAFVKQQLAQFTAGFWVWGLSAVLLTFLVLMLSFKILFSGSSLSREAFDTGQRVFINLTTGEVDGNARHTTRVQAMVPAGNPAADKSMLNSPIVSKEGLAPAPLASITVESDKGLLPIAGTDGTLPWKYYSRPYTPPVPKRPMVAIIFTNLALSKSLTRDVLQLPHAMTLSFSPYASDAKTWAREAREEGFESLIDLPMQQSDYPISDPGPYGLLESLSPDVSSSRLHWILSRFPGFVGVLAPIDEKLTANATALRPTLIELAARGVLFLYLKNSQNTALTELMKNQSLYVLGIDEVIDSEISQDAIEKQLQTLTDTAKKQGYAIAIAHSYPPTTEALATWLQTLPAQGVDLVPVSAIAKQLFP